jgi:DNA-binding transcriptional LysR family regulator
LELRHLRAFAALASQRHFGHAAASLNLTQPALTLRIQVLEKELGVQLVDRSSRDLHLTPAGQVLLPYASSLIEIEDEAIAEMKHHAAVKARRLRISYLALWDGLPTSIVATFRTRYPETTVETSSGYSVPNLERVLKRDADLAFFAVGTGTWEELSIRSIDRKEIVLLMAPTHPLAALDQVPVKKLKGVPMIALSPGISDAVVKATTSWLARHMGEDPNYVAYEPPDQLAEAVLHRENAVTIMNNVRASAAAHLGLVFRRLAPRPMLECGVAYRKDNHSETLASLLRIIDELVAPLPREGPAGFENLTPA